MKLLLFVSLFVAGVYAENKVLTEKFSWKTVDFEYPSKELKEQALASGALIPENVFIMGVDIWKNKLFLTTPRAKDGIPSTLNYIDLSKNNTASPALIPYPSLEANTPSDDPTVPRLNSVFRAQVDECDRLWVLDTGANQIQIYNLNDDSLIRWVVLGDDVLTPDTFFGTVTIDSNKNQCDKPFVYIPDLGGYGIVVYDFANDKAWRIRHNFFYLDPRLGDYNIGGRHFQWSDGVFHIVLGAQQDDGSRDAYFHAFSSHALYRVNTTVLQDENEAAQSTYEAYEYIGDRGEDSHTATSAIDYKTGAMIYSQVDKDAVNCWNTQLPLTEKNMIEVASDKETMIFPVEIRIGQNRDLWVISNRYPLYEVDLLSFDEPNFRVFTAPVDDVIKGTNCGL